MVLQATRALDLGLPVVAVLHDSAGWRYLMDHPVGEFRFGDGPAEEVDFSERVQNTYSAVLDTGAPFDPDDHSLSIFLCRCPGPSCCAAGR